MAKRDVGMAGSSGYDSEFYTTDANGAVKPVARTMRLQGMDPKKRIADSEAQTRRVMGRGAAGLPMTDKDKARMKAVGGSQSFFGRNVPDYYEESDLVDSIVEDDNNKRDKAFYRGQDQQEAIQTQRTKFAAQQKYGDNSFKPYQSVMPTLSKQIMKENAKRK